MILKSKNHFLKAHGTQCAPGIFNLNQKFHGLFCFCDLDICKIDQNQLKKPSVDGVPTIFTFSIVKMALKCHQIENRKTLSKENLFFDCSCYGTVLADGFFNWFWTILHISKSQKQKSLRNFWSRSKTRGVHCEM